MRKFPVYYQFISIQLKSIVEYRGAFLLYSASKALVFSVSVVMIWVLISRFEHIAGWSVYEVMFLYALNLAGYSLAGFFFYHSCNKLPEEIQSGAFDELLIRPVHPFLFLICKHFSYGYFSNLFVAVATLVVSINLLKLSFVGFDIVMFAFVIIGAALIHASIFLFTAVPSFWFVQSNSFTKIVRTFEDFIQYPLTIYPLFIQGLLTFVLPYAFINFYPAQYFLQKDDVLFHPVLSYLSPLVGVFLFFIAYRFWWLGVKHYKSTGS